MSLKTRLRQVGPLSTAMNSNPENSQSADDARHALSHEEPSTSAPAANAAGIVWPRELSIGSLEDQLEIVKRTAANGFQVVDAKLDQLRIVAATPDKNAQPELPVDSARSMLQSLLQTHRPRLVICASALRVQQEVPHEEVDRGCDLDWARRNAVYAAQSLQVADGSMINWPLAAELSEILHARKRIVAPWSCKDAPWSEGDSRRIVADDVPAIVQAECEQRAIPCLAIGVVRWLPGEAPSRELVDYQASASRAKKLGRMLRWAVKNRAAIKETAQAAEADLLAADQLATEVCELIKNA